MLLEQVILYDDRASQPAANTVPVGTLYYVTDESVTERSNGTTWDDFSDAQTGGVTTTGSPANGNLAKFTGASTISNADLSGDVTTSGGVATTIANTAVTTAKIANDAVDDTKLRNSGALSVIGRSANSTGDPADISASAASGAVLRESGSTLGFGTIVADGIASDAVTTVKILDDNVTYAKIQNVSTTDRILGLDSAGPADIEEIPVSSGLEFTGGPGLRVTAATRTFTVGITIDGGGSQITTGIKGYVQVPVAATIISWTILADQSGAIVIDVWKDIYNNFPPDNSDAIPGTDEPEITASGVKATSSSLGGWTTTSIAAGDCIGFNVDSCTSITRATLMLVCVATGA